MELPRLVQKKTRIAYTFEEKDIDVVRLNKVKNWHNANLTEDHFLVKETRASKSHSSRFVSKKRTTIIEVKPEKFDRNERRKVLEILKACLEKPVLGSLWVMALYNSPGHAI